MCGFLFGIFEDIRCYIIVADKHDKWLMNFFYDVLIVSI